MNENRAENAPPAFSLNAPEFRQEGTMKAKAAFPVHGWVGLSCVAVFWGLNWFLHGLRTHWAFFPLWLGYGLFVDALVARRTGGSLLKRGGVWAYARLFVISSLAWWLFELFNLRLGNWYYDGRQFFSTAQYAVLASINFSTVMPAVFGTAELVGTFGWIQRFGNGPRIPRSAPVLLGFLGAGLCILALLLIWPRCFFALVWIAVYLILDPLNVHLKNRSLLENLAQGDWRPVVSLATGCLVCGFFWEMWNFYSYPKWIYRLPFAEFLHIFEMPLPGYSGYPAFSLELFAFYHFVAGVLRLKERRNYIGV
jgi:hypothetical protein